MTYEQIRLVLTQRMTEFNAVNADRICYPNQPEQFTPPHVGVWCRFDIQHAPSIMAGMADRPYTRRPGQIVVQCFDRQFAGPAGVTELADAVVGHFAYWRQGNLECLEASLVDVGTADGFIQKNVIIRFRAG